MERVAPSSRRASVGLIMGTLCLAIGFWLRHRVASEAADITASFDLSKAFQNASKMNFNAEAGLFLIVFGGLIILITFWRWLG